MTPSKLNIAQQNIKMKKPRKNGAYQYGVSDGARTRDIRRHKPMLYQLSYTHHIKHANLKQLPINREKQTVISRNCWYAREDSNPRPTA